jgi:hypothetical protein
VTIELNETNETDLDGTAQPETEASLKKVLSEGGATFLAGAKPSAADLEPAGRDQGAGSGVASGVTSTSWPPSQA